MASTPKAGLESTVKCTSLPEGLNHLGSGLNVVIKRFSMTIALTSPITGGAQTGFTAPTYTLTADTAPSINGKQWAVTALGGTQAGVTTHSVAAPFTLSCFRPASFKQLGKANPVTGLIANVPSNVYKVIGRKGVLPLAGQPYRNAQISVVLEIPAGSDLADPANIRALCSAAFGAISQQLLGLVTLLRRG